MARRGSLGIVALLAWFRQMGPLLPRGSAVTGHQLLRKWEKHVAAKQENCEVCGKVANAANHPCRFEKSCTCWYGQPCKLVAPQ